MNITLEEMKFVLFYIIIWTILDTLYLKLIVMFLIYDISRLVVFINIMYTLFIYLRPVNI